MFINKIRSQINHYTSFFFYLILISSVSLALLYPRISSTLYSFERNRIWSSFEKEVITAQTIDPTEFWKLREFYNIGSFNFSSEGFNKERVASILDKWNVSVEKSILFEPFLIYESSYFNSVDALVSTSNLNDIINSKGIELITTVKRDNIFILKKDNLHILIFILPISEMRKSNGFFDYRDEKVKKKLEGKFWLNISQIEI